MYAFVTGFSTIARPSFAGARLSSRRAPVSTAVVSMAASTSVPFLEVPPKLTGELPGDVGFDPLGFSNKFDINFLREAEVKHGRICMLAMLGWVFPEVFFTLPDPAYSNTNPLAAVGSVGFLPVAQILLFIAVCEAAGMKKVYEDNCEDPGNFGIDPLGLSRSASAKAHYQLAEIKNGRLAMIAIGGAIHHALLTNQGLIAQITSKNFSGGYYIH